MLSKSTYKHRIFQTNYCISASGHLYFCNRISHPIEHKVTAIYAQEPKRYNEIGNNVLERIWHAKHLKIALARMPQVGRWPEKNCISCSSSKYTYSNYCKMVVFELWATFIEYSKCVLSDWDPPSEVTSSLTGFKYYVLGMNWAQFAPYNIECCLAQRLYFHFERQNRCNGAND